MLIVVSSGAFTWLVGEEAAVVLAVAVAAIFARFLF